MAQEFTEDEIQVLQDDTNIALALLERDFPVFLNNPTAHIFRHMVEGIKKFGPLYSTWMFPFERLNSWFTRRVLNRQYPGVTIMETYQV